MTDSLAGRVALITGAGQGVGRGIALELSRLGAAVAVNDLAADRAQSVVDEIVAAGGKAVVAAGDVTNAETVAQFVAAASELGTVDILVNNAGIPASGIGYVPFMESEPELWNKFVDINIFGVAHVIKAVLPGMIDSGFGRVITISSDSARNADGNLAMYAASKSGGATLTRAIAAEVGKHGITANVISLGTIANPQMPEDLLGKLARPYPVGRIGQPEDIASAVAYLASEGAGWVSGQTLSLNGGLARVG